MKASEPGLWRIRKAAHELGWYAFPMQKWSKHGNVQAGRTGQEACIPRSEIERMVGNIEDERVVVMDGHATQLTRLHAWARQERAGRSAQVLSGGGSGLNAPCRQLQRLLKLVSEDNVAEIVVTSPDRLARFGQAYLYMLLARYGVTLTVLDAEEEETVEQEFTQFTNALGGESYLACGLSEKFSRSSS